MNRITCLLLWVSLAGWAAADQVDMDVSLANPYLTAGTKNTTFLKVGLTGFELREQRAPVNVALVIDKSGSMSGEKIAQARKAAKMAVERLRSDDIVSVIAYDSGVEVLVPATKLTDKKEILQRLDQLQADGSTALFAGVSKGAAELRKFLDQERVNRVVLLSDGQANVGPQSPGELGELGQSLVKEGISVSTIGLGLGYNEDLMVKLAMKSDGNHVFVEDEQQLVGVFDREFGDILSVVAQEVELRIQCAEGVRPVRVLGREADIAGQEVFAALNQLYSGQEKYLILEVEIPGAAPESVRSVADVEVTYANMATQAADKLASHLQARFTDSAVVVREKVNQDTMADAVLLLATENNQFAMELRDNGEVERAKNILGWNADFLSRNSVWLGSEQLEQYSFQNRGQMDAIEDDNEYVRQRKIMSSQQISNYAQIGHGGYVENAEEPAQQQRSAPNASAQGGSINMDQAVTIQAEGNVYLQIGQEELEKEKKAGTKGKAAPQKPAETKVGF